MTARSQATDSYYRRVGLLALLGGTVAFGFTPIFVRLSEVGPASTGFYRMMIALPFLYAWLRLQAPADRQLHGRRRRGLAALVMLSLLLAVDLAVWQSSFLHTSVANATLVGNLHPIWVIVGAWLFLGERVGPAFIFGLVVAFAGVAVVLLGGGALTGIALGDILAFVASMLWAAYLLILKYVSRYYSTLTIMVWNSALTGLALMPIALVLDDHVIPRSLYGWAVLAGFALFVHVGGQSAFTYAFKHLPASFNSVGMLLMPPVSAAAAWAILGEAVSVTQAVGGAIVLSGIFLAHRAGAR